MEPMVTIPVADYNKLIDKALENSSYVEKIIKKLKSLYDEEKYPQNKYHNFYTVGNACESILEMIKNKGNIPEAVKEWTSSISSEKSES